MLRPAAISRPGAARGGGARGRGRGGLGFKRGGGVAAEVRAAYAQDADGAGETKEQKGNADFKAMFERSREGGL